MPTAVVHLKPMGSVAGTGLPSPTLYGALCWATAVLFGEEEATRMAEQLTCSDAFPLAWDEGGQPVRFFPMPVLPQRVMPVPDRSLDAKQQATRALNLHKRLKGVRALSQSLFLRFVRGELSLQALGEALQREQVAVRGACLMTREEAQRLGMRLRSQSPIAQSDIQHNEIDRWTHAVVEGRLFLREETFFARGSGLCFAVHVPDEHLLNRLPALCRYLEDTGVGGERSTGKGHFRFQVDLQTRWLEEPADADAWLTLSHYLPTPHEVQEWLSARFQPSYTLAHWQAKYEAMFVGGQAVYKPLRRLFAPGSVFPLGERREIYGRAVPSGQRLGHPVWVCGRALPVFIRSGGVV